MSNFVTHYFPVDIPSLIDEIHFCLQGCQSLKNLEAYLDAWLPEFA